VAEDRRVHEVGIGGVHVQVGDLAGILEPGAGPRLSRVRGLPHPIPRRDVAAWGFLSGADIDDVRVRGCDGNGADGARHPRAVRHGLPPHPTVDGLPDAASRRAKVVHVRLAGHAGDRRGPPSAVGADEPPRHRLKETGIVGRLGLSCTGQCSPDSQGENRKAYGTPDRVLRVSHDWTAPSERRRKRETQDVIARKLRAPG
jgi:hypothetical protein